MTTNPPFPPFRPDQESALEGGDADGAPADPAAVPAPPGVTQRVDRAQLKHFVTAIRSAEHQVGEHIIQALHDDETVAVLTTVMIGPDGVQRIVSAGLDPTMMSQVQQLLAQAAEERDEEVPCVGFHCYVRPKNKKKSLPEPGPDAAP